MSSDAPAPSGTPEPGESPAGTAEPGESPAGDPRQEAAAPDRHADEFGPPDVVITAGARVQASLWEAWHTFETERLGILLGDVRRYDETPREDGSVERIANKFTFPKARWEEHTFDFVAPEWLFYDRRHLSGLLVREVYHQRLEQVGDETLVTATARLWARSAVKRAVLKAIRGSVERVVRRAHRHLARQLEEQVRGRADGERGRAMVSQIGPPPPALARGRRRQIEAAASRLSSAELASALTRHLEAAPLLEQDRMEPRVLAEAWGLDEEEVIRGLLEAVHEGILSLRWELLCPSCEGARVRFATLDATGDEVHCTSCNIRYDANFPNAVAVSFRPSPSVRDFTYDRQCVGSPYHTPHVLARFRLEPGDSVEFQVDLEPGRYRLRDLRSLEAASLDASDGADHHRATVVLGEGIVRPAALALRPGRAAIALRSRLSVPSWVVLEKASREPARLTAGQLLSWPGICDMVPEDALGPEVNLDLRRSAVLVAEVFGGGDAGERIRDIVASAKPARLRTAGRHLVGLWDDFEGALGAAHRLDGLLEACSAAGAGIIVDRGDSASPAGRAIDEALAALRVSLPGSVTLPGGCATDEHVVAALRDEAMDVKLLPGPRLGSRNDYLLSFSASAGERRSPAGPALSVAGLSAQPHEHELLVGRYRLGGLLGEGGVGSVYEATDERTGAPVVVKVFKAILARSPSALQQCFNEARICSLLDHPNVVRLLDFGHTEGGRPLIVMPRLDGIELQAALHRRGTFDIASTCLVGRDVLAGLEAVHAAGVIHRDIKPRNVILTREGPARAVLIDFGIALEKSTMEHYAGHSSGTPMYLSPEQLAQQTPTAQSDLYAVGLILFQCLTGSMPHADLPRKEALKLRVAKPCPPVAEAATVDLPGDLSRAVDRALARDPRQRIGSATEMKALIDSVLEMLGASRDALDELAVAAAPATATASSAGRDEEDGPPA